jgi:O-antigen ligase
MPLALTLALSCVFPFLGVAAQSTGLYAVGIVAPAVVVFRARAVPSHLGATLVRIGMCFLAIWALFPLANVLGYFAQVPTDVSDAFERVWPEALGKPLTSRMSSAWVVSGLALVVFGVLARGRAARSVAVDEMHTHGSPRSLRAFLASLTLLTVVWAALLAFQHLTGVAFHGRASKLLPEHLMAGGVYRAFGFYGHPLSTASVGLGLFSFFWFLTWTALAAEVRAREPGVPRSPFSLSPNLPAWASVLVYASGSCAALLAVVMSGGRTALAFALAFSLFLPFMVKLEGRFARVRLVGTLAAFGGGVTVVALSGIVDRLRHVVEAATRGDFENRVRFWQVYVRMISDAPAFGHGHYWIENGLRTAYYDASGLADLNEKFNAHNLYLEALANVGIIGTAAALVLVVAGLRILRSLSIGAATQGPAFIFRALCAALGANFLHALTQNVYFDTNVLIPYLVIIWGYVWLAVTQAPFARTDPRHIE